MLIRLAIPLLVYASLVVFPAQAQAQAPSTDLDEVRQALNTVNAAWSRVRLMYDSATAEQLLAPGFFAALRDRRFTREEFIRAVSTKSPTSRLVRFDNAVLTIMPGGNAGEWEALVVEKLEWERTTAEGLTVKTYALWVTRDGYREENRRWVLTSSTEVMRQSWPAGRRPPMSDWDQTGGRPTGDTDRYPWTGGSRR